MKRRNRSDNSEQSRTSRWNRLNLKVFGPPHVGHYEGPWEEAEADPVCPFCGHRESAHERDTNADGKHFRRCPPAA
jgi:hypothetical protein